MFELFFEWSDGQNNPPSLAHIPSSEICVIVQGREVAVAEMTRMRTGRLSQVPSESTDFRESLKMGKGCFPALKIN